MKNKWHHILVVFVWLGSVNITATEATIKDSLNLVEKSNQAAIESQQIIDELSIKTQKMLEEYKQILQQTEYLHFYNFQLKQLEADQKKEIASLEQQLEQINITQMRILPLINSMVDALEKFIILDVPFQQQSRIDGIINLKERLRNPGLTLPDKYRLLLEAYQIETEYGRTIESYRDALVLEDETLSVDYLRIGRVALYYRTLDGARAGYWLKQKQQWQLLPESYSKDLALAIKVATNQVPAQLLSLPMINSSMINSSMVTNHE